MNLFLPPLRPPGALKEKLFRKLCIRCGKCVEICPHNSLTLAGGFGPGRLLPGLDPENTPCQLCMKCPPVCPTGALDPACTHMEQANMGQAHILVSLCHNYTNGPMCWTCYDRCPLRGKAIILKDGLTPLLQMPAWAVASALTSAPQKAVRVITASSDYIPIDAAPMASRQ